MTDDSSERIVTLMASGNTNPLVGLRVPPEVLAALKGIAKRDLATIQDVIRRALARFIAEETR